MRTIKLKFVAIIICITSNLYAQKISYDDCKAELKDGLLTIENKLIQRIFAWEKGNLKTLSLTDFENNKTWKFNADISDFSLSDEEIAKSGTIEFEKIEQNDQHFAHIKVSVVSIYNTLQLKRVYKIYPDCPAIACEVYLRGYYSGSWTNYDKKGRISTAVFERLSPKGVHWRTKTIAFYDRTDDCNNLVQENEQLVFAKQNRTKGNLIFIKPEFDNKAFFVLKESPNHLAQLDYPGCDFVSFQTKSHNLVLQVVGLNINTNELIENEWIRCSGFVTGVSKSDDLNLLSALKTYQEQIRVKIPDRDEMIMMNTWGDRGQDANVNEEFCIREIKAAHKLGINFFQIDDGWQTGRTGNSATKGGSLNQIWDKENYWQVDPAKFPRGLKPIVQEAKNQNIKLGLWFNPSHDDSYENWKKDAEVLIGFYKEFGIKTFKIDGVIIDDKKAELNFRSFLDTLLLASNQQIIINLDVTGLASRPGFHFFNEYGNIFLENRYTDWVNYYPHWTLRNLWMLSKYMPAQNLQLEFLNKWRNSDLYEKDDVLAPINIPFDYQFALTMMAQPLAWFEGSKLPLEAFSIAPLIKDYKSKMAEIHSGKIFPIGEEPSGKEWTGFQSILNENEGFILVLKEYNSLKSQQIETFLKPGKKIKLTNILGYGEDFNATVNKSGSVEFTLQNPWSFAMYKYQILN